MKEKRAEQCRGKEDESAGGAGMRRDKEFDKEKDKKGKKKDGECREENYDGEEKEEN
jgi:hypothetical protein